MKWPRLSVREPSTDLVDDSHHNEHRHNINGKASHHGYLDPAIDITEEGHNTYDHDYRQQDQAQAASEEDQDDQEEQDRADDIRGLRQREKREADEARNQGCDGYCAH